jgi:hypothetical protein
MTREDIIRMAREAGCPVAGIGPMTFDDKQLVLMLERFAALVASAEREACAEVCKKHADVYAMLEQNPTAKSAWAACIDTRDAIRARP